ncbi:hypothetical protein PAECIP111893_00651 [Paenibacillus plantiphilus]|uniref:Uncharacterized protein n=1 Tax=Paenibacillus plantiphilus TaxID=2905650 RepID=A0ABM9BUU4_9BACL|nr:DUF6809 family protein [Paenibacillus plantiphilus]CAH1195253.1 hypothetical protein PAECIP111893_00651 [Paenibacillus plantiphilus]
MKTILEELYNDNLLLSAHAATKDPQYRISGNKINEEMDKWKTKLSKDDYDNLIDLLDLHAQIHDMDTTASFAYGFKLGASIMLEVLDGKSELIRTK